MDEDGQVVHDVLHRKTIVEKIFTFKLHQFAVEERLGHQFALRLLQVYFVILLVSFVNPREVFGWNMFAERFATAAAVPMFLFFLTFFGTVFAAVFMTNPNSNEPCLMLKVFCYVKLLTVYLVFPLANLIYSRAIVDGLDPGIVSTHSSAVISLGYLFVVSFGVIAIFSMVFLRNNYPTRGSMNVVASLSESLLYVLNSVVQLHQQIRDRSWLKQVSPVLDLVQYFLSVAVIIVALRYSVFWNYRLNTQYLMYTCQLLVVRVYFNNIVSSFSDIRLMSGLLFTFPLLSLMGRLSQNLVFHVWSFRVALNNRGIDYDRYVTVFTYDLLKEQERQSQLEDKERELMLMLQYTVKAKKYQLASKKFETVATEPALLYLEDLTMDKMNKLENVYTLMKLKLLFLKLNLSTLNHTLNLLKKKLGKKAPLTFEYFHLRSLMQVRMEQLYSGTIDTQQYERTTIGQIYQAMSTRTNDRLRLDSHIDLNRVFATKDIFESIVDRINVYLSLKFDLFSRLYDGEILGIKYIHNTHVRLRNIGATIDTSFDEFFERKGTPPYLLATAAAYHLKVRYQVKQADLYFKKYRVLLSKLQMHNRTQQTINRDNIGFDSVIFKVDISKNHLGQIIDITPGYKEHLGECRREQGVIGFNINTLFPGAMSADHSQMMAKLDNLKTFNVQSESILNGFDGFLRSISYYVKIYGSLNGEMSSIAWVRVRDPGLLSILLVDDKLDVLSADESFWQVLRMLGFTNPVTNLHELSESLCWNIDLVEFLQTQQDSQDVENEKSFLRWKEDIKEIYKVFDKVGIVHRVKPQQYSSQSDRSKTAQLASTFESIEFHNKRYFKVSLSFDITQNDKSVRNFKTMMAQRTAFLTMARSSEMQISTSNVQNSASNLHHTESNDNDSMEIAATVHTNVYQNFMPEQPVIEQVPFNQIIEAFTKLQDVQRLLPTAVEKGFPEEIAYIITNYASHGGYSHQASAQSQAILGELAVEDKEKALPHSNSDRLLKFETLNTKEANEFLRKMSFNRSNTNILVDEQQIQVKMAIPEKRQLTLKEPTQLPLAGLAGLAGNEKQLRQPDLQRFMTKMEDEGVPTTRRDLVNESKEGEGFVITNRFHHLKDSYGMTMTTGKGKDGNNKGSDLKHILQNTTKTHSPTNKTLRHTSGSKSRPVARATQNIKKVKAQEDHVMFSYFPPNVERLMRAIVSFSTRVTRKIVTGDALESMGTRSTTTTNSKNTTVFRRVSNTIHSHKRVQTVYILIFGLIFISCIYIGLFQYLNSQLAEYNESNVYCMIFLTYFVGIDRALLTGARAIDGQLEYIENANNKDDFLAVSQVIIDSVNVSDPMGFMSNSVLTSATLIEYYMQAVEERLATLDSRQDEENIVALMSHKRNYRILNRFADEFYEVEELTHHSISWWKLLSTILYNFKYVVDYSRRIYQEAVDSDYQLSTEDVTTFGYLQKLKLEIDRLVYEDNLGFMRGIMEEAMDYMITFDRTYHFDIVNGVMIAGCCVVPLLLAYLYYMTLHNSRRMYDLADNYCLLKIWELHAMLEDIADEQTTYSMFMYNEVHMVNKYVDFNSIMYALNNSRVIKLQDNYSTDKVRVKLKRDYVPRSLKAPVVASLMNIFIYGVLLVVIQVFKTMNDKRLVMEESIMAIHGSLIEVECNFLNTIIYVNYGDYVRIANHTPSEDFFESSIPTAIGLMSELRNDIKTYFGAEESDTLLQLLYGDLCEFFVADTVTDDADFNDYTFCKGLNPALTLKGLVGFLQAEKQFLDDIRMQLERDHMDMIVQSRTQLVEGIRSIFFSVPFFRHRTAHRRFIDLFYSRVIPITIARVEQIRDLLSYYISKVSNFAIWGLYVILFALFALTIHYQAVDLEHFYEIFTTIDPFFLVNNKYLFNKMREAYQGII